MRENSATILSTVPLPAGADEHGAWADWDNTFRVVYTPETKIAGTSCTVFGSAVQLPDGSISHRDCGDAPHVMVQGDADGITTVQARELAAAIVATADLIDGWVSR
ncbi:hypothetical protein [Mycobacterium bourgelatii]|uniref:Uncharacterized protein n=1 Tax=Mycobacterium bourgelatii TaxID=1273442 RepID=A0A7I9YN08_MYCBU|nr:hypothetical protein [Mycobacterium bourgelatii]MCV6975634.1 hypothetical protein [Mycobacterium bourgelatii]GFG89952.1 hypothetical protein MBOU_19940 [Mycobacterium bourgelatii]